jgi:hypothetical protein
VFDPRRFSNVADFVYSDPSHQSEEFVRTGIGRAYYAAHIYARDLLVGMPRVKLQRDRSGNPTHGGVVDVLKRSKQPHVGHALDQLLAHRKRADYRMDVPSKVDDLREARNLSTAILRDIANCF